MNLHQLYYFKTVAELKHFTKAANKLMVAQPSLSHAINELEAELGVSLFERGSRNVSLTKYGELFLGYVERSLGILDEGREKLYDLIDPARGSISLSYVSSLDSFIPYIMAKYYSKNDDMYTLFQLYQRTNNDIKLSLLDGTSDLGIGTYMEDNSLCSHKLGEHELVLIVSEKHEFAKLDSIDLTTIGNEKIITYDDCCDIREWINNLFKIVGISPTIGLESTHDTVIYSSVAANYGVALVPAPLGMSHFNVKAIPILNDLPKREVYLTWKNYKYISPAVCQFRDFIIEQSALLSEFRKEVTR